MFVRANHLPLPSNWRNLVEIEFILLSASKLALAIVIPLEVAIVVSPIIVRVSFVNRIGSSELPVFRFP